MTFIALAVGFFALTEFGRGLNGPIGQNLAQFNAALTAGEWWRLFTPVLLHASLMHILFNMWALWILGPQIERGVGSLPFVSLYLASAAAGGALVYLLGDAGTVAVGASGAIFGLFGVWFNWAVRRRNTLYGRALLRQIGFLLLINAAIPLFIPTIAWQAHLGGLIAGFAIGEIWSRMRGPRASALRTLIGAAVAILGVLTTLI